MYKLPPNIESFLKSLGVNTERLNWKIHYLIQDWEKFKQRFKKEEKQKYKYCECGELALAEYTVCPKCGRKLDSYSTYKVKSEIKETFANNSMVSIIFISIIVALFAMQFAAMGPQAAWKPDTMILLRFGATFQPWVLGGEYWRLLSAGLCHIGIIHILFNGYAIWVTLPYFEEEIGAWRTLLLLTLTQLGAFGLDFLYGITFQDYYPTAGASGIAFGIIGFGVAYFHRIGRITERNFFLQWTAYGVLFGIAIARINNIAHLGGFLVGLPLGYWMAGRAPKGPVMKAIQTAGILCLFLWGWAIVMMVITIFTGNRFG